MAELFATTSVAPPSVSAVALTTIWTAPDHCPKIVPWTISVAGDCAPPYEFQHWFERWPQRDDPLSTSGVYSPGVCFDGYVIGFIQSTGTLNRHPIAEDETAAMCIPKGYTGLPWAKIRLAQAATHIVVDADVTTWRADNSVPAFQIRWKSSDIASLASSPVWRLSTTALPFTYHDVPLYVPLDAEPIFVSWDWPSTETPTLTGSSINATTESSTVPQASRASDLQLKNFKSSPVTSGAIAGITIGAVAALAGVVLGVLFLLRRHNQGHSRRPSDPISVASDTVPDLPEVLEFGGDALKIQVGEVDVATSMDNDRNDSGTRVMPSVVIAELEANNSPIEHANGRRLSPQLSAEGPSPISLLQDIARRSALELAIPNDKVFVAHTGPSASPSHQEADELEMRHAELESQKKRLIRIQEVEEEQRAIERRIEELRRLA